MFCRSSGHTARPARVGSCRRRYDGCVVLWVRINRHGTDRFGHVKHSCIAVVEHGDRFAGADHDAGLRRREGRPAQHCERIRRSAPQIHRQGDLCSRRRSPGLAGPEVVAELSDLAAAEVTDTNSSPEIVSLKALVGTVKSANGDAFVNAFLSRVGEARNDTVTLGGHIVRYFNTPLARATPTPRGQPSPSATSRSTAGPGIPLWLLGKSRRRRSSPESWLRRRVRRSPQMGARRPASTPMHRAGAATPHRTTRAGYSFKADNLAETPAESVQTAPWPAATSFPR